MYWGQIAVAATSAVGAVWLTFDQGYGVGTCAAIGAISYICVRWTIAWGYRIRYWYNRGTRGVYYESCPNCEARRYRTQGDWILRCHSCGWKPGWLGLRWLTRSVPSIQLRRTVVGPQLLVVIVAAVLIFSGLTTGVTMASLGAAVDGSATAGDPSPDGDISNTPTPGGETSRQTAADADISNTPTSGSEYSGETTTDTDDGRLNITEIERWVWRYTNAERSQRGLNNVSYAPRVADVARDHSENMAKHDYIGHTEPNGETGEERYQGVCNYSGSGYTFGENAFGAYYEERFRAWKTDETVYLTTEKEVARYLVDGWMRSEGHRENLLHEEWTELGVGVAASGNELYASQTFC